MGISLHTMTMSANIPVSNATKGKTRTYITISELGPFDVLCGRSKSCWNNIGNLRFREVVNAHLTKYLNSGSNFMRSVANREIAYQLLDKSNPRGSFRFFKRTSKGSDGGHDGEGEQQALIELLDEKESTAKIAQALRDSAVRHKRKSKIKFNPKLTIETSTEEAMKTSMHFSSIQHRRTYTNSNREFSTNVEDTKVIGEVATDISSLLREFAKDEETTEMETHTEKSEEHSCMSSLFGDTMDEIEGNEAPEENCYPKETKDTETPEEKDLAEDAAGVRFDKKSLEESRNAPPSLLKYHDKGSTMARRTSLQGSAAYSEFIVEELRSQSSASTNTNTDTNTNTCIKFAANLKKHLALSQKAHDDLIRYCSRGKKATHVTWKSKSTKRS